MFGGGHFFFDRTGQGQGRPRRTGGGGHWGARIGNLNSESTSNVGPVVPYRNDQPIPAIRRRNSRQQRRTALHVLCLSLPFYCVRACLRACLFIASLFLVVLFRDILALSRLSAGPSADVSSPHLAVSRHRHPPEASKRTETLARARGTRLTSHVDRRAGHARRGRRTKSLFWREKVGGLDLRGPREKKRAARE